MEKIMLLENIRSMQNVGAIFRNADGAGFTKLLLTWHTPTPPRGDISKTALGAQNTVDWEYFDDTSLVLQELKKQWFEIYWVELTPEAIDYRQLFFEKCEKNICLVVGNEVAWVTQNTLDFCDKHIIIPMKWHKESLNVSVAAWIVMYALVD